MTEQEWLLRKSRLIKTENPPHLKVYQIEKKWMKQHPSLLKWVENESNNTQVSEITQGLSEWAKTDRNNESLSNYKKDYEMTQESRKWIDKIVKRSKSMVL